jgi:hypothetical protein
MHQSEETASLLVKLHTNISKAQDIVKTEHEEVTNPVV